MSWQFSKGLIHPTRIRILKALDNGPATASELARLLEVDERTARYHCDILVEIGLVRELRGDPEQVDGGAVALTRLAKMTRLEAEPPSSGRRPATASDLRDVVGREIDGIRIEPPDGLVPDHIAHTAAEVDKRACRAISQAFQRANEVITKELKRSQRSAQRGGKRFEVLIAYATFESLRSVEEP